MGGVDCTTNAQHYVTNVTPHPTMPLVKDFTSCPINTYLYAADLPARAQTMQTVKLIS